MKPKKSLDGKVRFYEGTHNYFLGRKKLTSVTTFLKKYFKPFDELEIARSLCSWHPKYKPLGIRKTIAMWREAAEHGTRTHFLLEQYVQTAEDYLLPGDPELSKYEERDLNKYTFAKLWLQQYFEKTGKYKACTEVIIYDKELGLAGQIDLMVEQKDGTYNLIDYKTNDKITTSGYKGEKAKEPIDDMDDCSFTKYTLQLSMYAYMLEKQGKKIGTLTLLHLQEDKVVPMNVEYRKDIIERLINDKKE